MLLEIALSRNWPLIAGILLNVTIAGAAHAERCATVAPGASPQQVYNAFLCAVKESAREPASTSYRGIFLTTAEYTDRRTPSWVLCGESNGRNGYGGITGWTVFAYMPDAVPALSSAFVNVTYCSADRPVIVGKRYWLIVWSKICDEAALCAIMKVSLLGLPCRQQKEENSLDVMT
jgi:hypothetical protein